MNTRLRPVKNHECTCRPGMERTCVQCGTSISGPPHYSRAITLTWEETFCVACGEALLTLAALTGDER